MLSAGATWKAKENPAPVRAAYLRSKASRPEVLSRSPCSAPIKLSSPEDSTYKRHYLRRRGARRSAGIEPPVFPLVIHAPQLPRNKKTQALGLSRIYYFGYFMKYLFGFPGIVPVSGDGHQVVMLAQRSKIDKVTVVAVGRVVQELIRSDFRPYCFICSRIIRADEDEGCIIKIAGFVCPPVQQYFAAFSPLQNCRTHGRRDDGRLSPATNQFS